ncbi:MAG TPA: hypothetical protein VGF64_00670 [Acidimicrobiales bacterium]
MTIIVLLILASMWVAVLLPSILRTREAVRSTDSVGDFRRQLWVLARTRRASLGMAYSSQHAALPRRPVAPSGPDVPARAMVSDRAPVASSAQPVAWATRQHTLRRRREVLKTLLTAITLTFLLGAVPSLRMAWGFSAVLAGLTLSYLAALMHLRSVALERSSKVAFLDRHRQPEPAFVLRRSAN